MTTSDGAERLLLSGLDGLIYALDALTGRQLAAVDLGSPLAAPVVVTDELVLAIGVDGVVFAIERQALS